MDALWFGIKIGVGIAAGLTIFFPVRRLHAAALEIVVTAIQSDLIEDAMAGYLQEVTQVREMSNQRSLKIYLLGIGLALCLTANRGAGGAQSAIRLTDSKRRVLCGA